MLFNTLYTAELVAQVWRAEWTMLNGRKRTVAVKVLKALPMTGVQQASAPTDTHVSAVSML